MDTSRTTDEYIQLEDGDIHNDLSTSLGSNASGYEQDVLRSLQESHMDRVAMSYSQSVGVSASYRKQVSFAESTPLILPDTSTIVFSYNKGQLSSASFVKEKPFHASFKDRSTRILRNVSMSVQHFGEQTLNLAQQRALFQSLSLPEIQSFDRRASSLLTFLNIQGMTFSVSTLALPYVVATSGLSGILSIILLGLISLYTCIMVVDCQYKTSERDPTKPKKRIYATFIEVGTAAIQGRVGGIIMKTATFTSLMTEIYVFILLGQSTSQLTKAYVPGMDAQHWILVWVTLLVPLLGITLVSVLAWVSFTSLVMFIIVVVIMYTMFFSNLHSWNIANIPIDFHLDQFLIAYGVILNSYNIHWSIPAVEASMENPESYNVVMVSSFITNIILKALFAILGTLAYGPATGQSVIENLPSSSVVMYIGSGVILLALYFYFPMGMFVVFEMVDMYFLPYFPIFHDGKCRKALWLLLSRGLVLALVTYIAVSCPEFGFIVSIIGSIRGTLVSIALPCIAHLKFKWGELSLIVKLFEISIMIICVAFGIGGAYYAAKGMAISAG